MPKQLQSADPNPRDNSFKTFGLLPDQTANKGAFATSATIMIVVTLLVVLAGFLTPALNPPTRADFMLLAPPPPPPPPPPVKPPPPPPKPKVEPPPVVEPPKDLPKPDPTPEPSKPSPPQPTAPQPPPKAVNPPPPVVALTPNRRAVASTPLPVVANTTNINRKNTDFTQPVGPVGLNDKKVPANNGPMDMNATKLVTRKTPGNEIGTGPDIGAAVTSKRGGGNNPNGTEPTVVAGVIGGKPGSRGPVTNPVTGPVSVSNRTTPPPAPPTVTKPVSTLAQSAKVASQPNPNDFITADAKKNHIAGTIQVKVHVLASGVGQVIGLAGPGLGHGLNEATLTIASQMKWKPALDANGRPIDSDIIVGVRFQSAAVE